MGWMIGRLSLTLVTVTVLAVALPRLYDLAFAVDAAPTQLFYSPVRKAFVFREHRGDHDFRYADQHGDTFDRRTFETLIPFIYYRNMELWGLMPLEIDGHVFDKPTILAHRQVFELIPDELQDRGPAIPVYPLMESDPEQAGLRFPEDVFRMTGRRMEFLNVDTNQVDEDLTTRFSAALSAEGFQHPARLVAGKPTILKPFDEGYFLVDAAGAVFHVKRVKDQPLVVRTPISNQDLTVRDIKVIENKRRDYYGFLLTTDNRLFLMSYDNYRLVQLPTAGYAPDRMDYKLILNPLYATAIYGDDALVRAVAMTPGFEPIDRYQRSEPDRDAQLTETVRRILFPVTLSLGERDSRYLSWQFEHHGWPTLIGNLTALALLLALTRIPSLGLRAHWSTILLTALSGVFGLAAALLLPPPTQRRG